MSSSLTSSKQQSWIQKRPLLRDAYFTDLQNGSYIAFIYSIVESIFMICLVVFDIYCLSEAQPGTTNYRYFDISFLFVYSGNAHVRNLLIFCSAVSFLLSLYLLVSSFILLNALKKEHEQKFQPWLIAAFLFTVWRLIAIIFRSISNDIYYSYHQAMLVIWIILIAANIFFWLVVYSNFQELADITRLEDMAKLKMGTMSSLNASRSLSHHSINSMKNTQSNSLTPKGSYSTASV
ncbi:uncharacterized protein LOC106464144 [Limulus polyphemus]|uniref:Uncharacterized protein LOC106464144 n=1 Tax=Limulus polyphemus TaxID=6850 RepID=A0ABM1BDC8_LIMPO|nr:uncharacterized protein LOC106464144 [Limulus polyphemus]